MSPFCMLPGTGTCVFRCFQYCFQVSIHTELWTCNLTPSVLSFEVSCIIYYFFTSAYVTLLLSLLHSRRFSVRAVIPVSLAWPLNVDKTLVEKTKSSVDHPGTWTAYPKTKNVLITTLTELTIAVAFPEKVTKMAVTLPAEIPTAMTILFPEGRRMGSMTLTEMKQEAFWMIQDWEECCADLSVPHLLMTSSDYIVAGTGHSGTKIVSMGMRVPDDILPASKLRWRI